jgi:hypothetical protein
MKLYHVEFAIEVMADTAEGACRQAWELMTRPDSLLPVGTVTDPDTGDKEDIDLQDLAETTE